MPTTSGAAKTRRQKGPSAFISTVQRGAGTGLVIDFTRIDFFISIRRSWNTKRVGIWRFNRVGLDGLYRYLLELFLPRLVGQMKAVDGALQH